MDLALQLGYGMGQLADELTRRWQLTTSILSPRDLDDAALVSWAQRLNRATGSVLLDPQFYMARADHERLTSHLYWPQGYDSDDFYQHGGLESMVTNLLELNMRLNAAQMVLPGSMAQPVTDEWIARQKATLSIAHRLVQGRLPLVVTLCLSSEALRSDEQVHRVLEEDRDLDYSAAYVVCEHPTQAYRIQDPIWLANLLDLTAGLKLHGRRVIVGYCQHQSLLLACSSVDVVASGTWMNVRSFVPGKFVAALQDEIAQRQVWYFCPQSFSEHTMPYLDIALKTGVLSQMAPRPPSPSDYAAALFSGAPPTAVVWGEPQAFRHYLGALRGHARNARRSTFQETVDAHLDHVDKAEELLSALRRNGVLGGTRDFSPVLDAHRAAIALHIQARGELLSRHWASL
jgi:hypothetical protein